MGFARVFGDLTQASAGAEAAKIDSFIHIQRANLKHGVRIKFQFLNKTL